MIKEAIVKLVDGHHLTREEAALTANTIMSGEATPSQIAALITALRIKGETPDEITGFAGKMREYAVKIHPKAPALVDTCGTGGDVSFTFNISTISAFVAAGAGVAIAKHGNRSVSSKCGSADLLEALGIRIDLPPEKVAASIDAVGVGFMFAPNFHPAMRHAGPTRREIGIRTIFNILGPLTNPAGAQNQILGVYSERLTEVMAEVLKNLGARHALVVHGMDGLDEIAISDRTKVSELKEGKVRNYFIKPEDFGFKRAPKEMLTVQNVEESKNIACEILEQRQKGPRTDIVLMNAAAAIYVAGAAKTMSQGVKLAEGSIGSGEAFNKMEGLKHFH
ncbi:MAG TPA: anthranilate phosphoribosyltransferase [Candidatus Omnitrophota bacterium]|nr:anthranilate phosphoribosyltransferase [Candidatus Omnitrophota bacterium]